MSGWDVGFEFDPDDSFISLDNSFEPNVDPFESINETSFSGTVSETPVQGPPSTPIFAPRSPFIPLQQLSRATNDNDNDDLAQENCKLREYFASLKDRAERATNENKQLKEQLDKWREGFRSAMFSGIGIKK